MKTILVPVDFSKQSLNAVEYAAEMALYTQAKLILLHVYDNTPPALDIPVVITIPAVENGIKEELHRITKNIEDKYGDGLVGRCLVKLGFVVEEINLSAEENNVDMVVMGMQGAGYLTERLLGSITTSVIRRSKKPVLVVGKHMHFKKPQKILLANDGSRVDNDRTYECLKQLLNTFNAHLYVVHIVPEAVLNNDYDDFGSFKLDEEWLNQSLSFHHINHKDTTDGINDFIRNHDIDLLVMIPHKHDFFERLIHEPETQKMTFHSTVPLLTIPELV